MLELIQNLEGISPQRGLYLADRVGGPPVFYPYATLAARVAACAEHYRSLGVKCGQHVILPFETLESVFCSLFALMELGAVPLSVKPYIFSTPRLSYVEFLQCISTRYDAEAILNVPSLAALELPLRRLPLPAPDALQPGARLRQVGPKELAFVQFSSGSTSFPKGVPVTQRNLLANLKTIAGHDGRTSEDRAASWLPLYHDMGLIGLMTCLLMGNDTYVSQPMQFLMEPLGWLESLSERRIHMSVIPNFAINYLLKHLSALGPQTLSGLDLSALRIIYLGSEPIDIDNLERFTELLQPYGLGRDVIKPCYGMAEAVLMVSCVGLGECWRVVHAPNGLPAISVGRPMEKFEVRLRTEAGYPCSERELGEIEIRGGSLAERYYMDERPLCDEDGFYASGDVGFLEGGELFITGRINDRIKINGQSYFSSDFEQAVERLSFIRPGRIAVIQAHGKVVVLAEVKHSAVLMERVQHQKRVCEAVLEGVGVTVAPEDVLFIRLGQLQKTSNGKLQRQAIREAYEQGQIESVEKLGVYSSRVLQKRIGGRGEAERSLGPR